MSEAVEEVIEGELVDGEGNTVTVDQAVEAKETQQPEGETEERPEWLPEKFKTADDMAKSYAELEKTLREKGKVAPESYEMSEDIGLDPEDETYKQFSEMAKTSNLTNEQLNSVLGFAVEAGLLDAPVYENEMKELGAEGDKIISSLKNFASNKLSEDEQEVFNGMIFTAKQAKLLNKVILGTNPTAIPAKAGESVGNSTDTMQRQLSELLNNPKIRTDNDLKVRATELADAIAKSKK